MGTYHHQHSWILIDRLLAEKMNKMERKNNAQIIMLGQGEENTPFWEAMGGFDINFSPRVSSLLIHV